MKFRILTILFILFLFIRCKKEPAPDTVLPPPISVGNDQVGISGKILGSDGYGIAGANVVIDGNSTITDSSGFYKFIGKVSNADKVILQISKTGYFSFIKTLVVEKETDLAELNLYLQEELITGSFSSSNGGTISTQYLTLNFPSNAITKIDGTIYQGIVTVKMPLIDFNEYKPQFPGDARAESSSNEIIALETFGGVLVKLLGSNGEELKISKPIDYSYKTNTHDVNILPSSIKLYLYDEINFIWKECGEAILNGKNYTGTTSNLNYLQWAKPHPIALLSAVVMDIKMNKAAGCQFNNYCSPSNSAGKIITRINDNGKALSYVPALNQSKASFSTPCDFLINSNGPLFDVLPIEIGATSNQNFTIDLTSMLTTIKGTVEDCSFLPVKGSVELVFDGKIYKSDLKNGAFSIGLMSCKYLSGIFTIYDEHRKVLLKDNRYYFAKGTTINLPPISLCETPLIGTIDVFAEGVNYHFQTPQDTIGFEQIVDGLGSHLNVLHTRNKAGQNFYFTYIGTTGVIPLYTLNLGVPNLSKNYFLTWGIFTPGNVVINKFKIGNTIMEGTFQTKTQINFSQLNSPIAEVSGSFNVMRK